MWPAHKQQYTDSSSSSTDSRTTAAVLLYMNRMYDVQVVHTLYHTRQRLYTPGMHVCMIHYHQVQSTAAAVASLKITTCLLNVFDFSNDVVWVTAVWYYYCCTEGAVLLLCVHIPVYESSFHVESKSRVKKIKEDGAIAANNGLTC